MDLDTFCSYVAKNSLRISLKRQEAEPRASRESERYSVVIVVQYSDARRQEVAMAKTVLPQQQSRHLA